VGFGPAEGTLYYPLFSSSFSVKGSPFLVKTGLLIREARRLAPNRQQAPSVST
jgi:hypothetical protein